MPIDCKTCGQPNSARNRICQSCGGNLYAEIKPAAACAGCHSSSPSHRMAHWMDIAPEDLKAHLVAEFGEHYSRCIANLAANLSAISEYRARYSRKTADESGHWLSPGQAYLQRMQAAARHDLGAEIEAFIRVNDLRRRPNESHRDFVLRCKAAGDWEGLGIRINVPRSVA